MNRNNNQQNKEDRKYFEIVPGRSLKTTVSVFSKDLFDLLQPLLASKSYIDKAKEPIYFRGVKVGRDVVNSHISALKTAYTEALVEALTPVKQPSNNLSVTEVINYESRPELLAFIKEYIPTIIGNDRDLDARYQDYLAFDYTKPQTKTSKENKYEKLVGKVVSAAGSGRTLNTLGQGYDSLARKYRNVIDTIRDDKLDKKSRGLLIEEAINNSNMSYDDLATLLKLLKSENDDYKYDLIAYTPLKSVSQALSTIKNAKSIPSSSRLINSIGSAFTSDATIDNGKTSMVKKIPEVFYDVIGVDPRTAMVDYNFNGDNEDQRDDEKFYARLYTMQDGHPAYTQTQISSWQSAIAEAGSDGKSIKLDDLTDEEMRVVQAAIELLNFYVFLNSSKVNAIKNASSKKSPSNSKSSARVSSSSPARGSGRQSSVPARDSGRPSTTTPRASTRPSLSSNRQTSGKTPSRTPETPDNRGSFRPTNRGISRAGFSSPARR